jgi:hypothetical protein
MKPFFVLWHDFLWDLSRFLYNEILHKDTCSGCKSNSKYCKGCAD